MRFRPELGWGIAGILDDKGAKGKREESFSTRAFIRRSRKLAGIADPWAYLRDVLDKLSRSWPHSRLDGCTRSFSPEFLDKLAGLTRAVHEDTRAALHAAFVELGMVRADKEYDFDTARSLVRGFYGPLLRDEVRAVPPGAAKGMREIFADKRALMKLTLPGEFLFLFRIRFGLLSVLARLGARANWFRLEERFANRPGIP